MSFKSGKLPEYHPLSLILFAIGIAAVFFLPLFFVVVLFFLVIKIRKQKKSPPECLFHFMNNEEVFLKICRSNCLMSLTGGRAYATQIFNPYLGFNFVERRKDRFLIAIFNYNRLFKPVISKYGDLYKVWMWWKSFRGEWNTIKQEDVSLMLTPESFIHVENKTFRRFIKKLKINFHYCSVHHACSLPTPSGVIKIQKVIFGIGEWLLSVLVLAALIFFNFMSIMFFKWPETIYSFITDHQLQIPDLPKVFPSPLQFGLILATLAFAVALHILLKKAAIRKRIKILHG